MLIGFLLGPGFPAEAQPPCLDYANYLHVVDIIDVPALFSGPIRMAVSPDRTRAYVAGVPSVLYVVDISDPVHPSVRGSVNLPAFPRALAGGDGMVAVLEDSTLRVVDAADPMSPFLAGSTPLAGSTSPRMALNGSVAYVAAGSGGLVLADLSVPSAPRVAGGVDTLTAADVGVEGNYAYVAGGAGGLYVVDVSDPDAPLVAGDLSLGSAARIAVQGSRAYVLANAGLGQKLQVVDISAPALPELLGTVGEQYDAFSELAADGNLVYLMDTDIRIVDVLDPQAPNWLGSVRAQGNIFLLDSENAYVLGFPSNTQALFVLDISNPSDPPPGFSLDLDCPQDVVVQGAYAYVVSTCSAGFKGLYVIDLTPVAGPEVAGSVPLVMGSSPDPAGLAVDGSVACIAAGSLVLVDVSNPGSPSLIKSVPTPGYANAVALAGGLAFVSDSTEGLLVFDISSPSSPALIGQYPTPLTSRSVAVSQNLVFMGSSDVSTIGTLHAIDVSDPYHPALAGSLATSGIVSVVLEGNLAYVSQGYEGLDVIEVSDPAAMAVISHVAGADHTYDVALDGPFAYVCQGYAKTEVFDVSDPGAPLRIGRLDSGYLDRAVAVGEEYALVWDRSDVQFVPKQCEPGTPVYVTGLRARSENGGIRISWSVLDGRISRFTVYRSAGSRSGGDVREPFKDLTVPPDGFVAYLDKDVAPGREYTYTIEGLLSDGSRAVFGSVRAVWDGKTVPARLAVAPNPARGSVDIKLALSRRGNVELAVFDASGRRVRALFRGEAGSGETVFHWDGLDATGRAAAAGLYYVRLSGDVRRVARIVLIP